MRALSVSHINSNRVLSAQAEPVAEHVQYVLFLRQAADIRTRASAKILNLSVLLLLRIKMVLGQQNWFCSKRHSGLEQRR